MTDPWARPDKKAPTPNPQSYAAPSPQDNPTVRVPSQQHDSPTTAMYSQPPPTQPPPTNFGPSGPSGPSEPPKQSRFTRIFRDPLSIVLILVIVVALAASGLLGGELYARNRADEVVAKSVECVVQDTAEVSFGARPFLLQYATKSLSGLSIQTAGNNIREAKGMKLDLAIDDIKLQDSANSKGTIGSLDATITWSAEGIKETLQGAIPIVGGAITSVTTNPSDGTVVLDAGISTITTKPQVVDNGLQLQVVNLTGLGFTLPREIVQPALDTFTSQLTKNYPLGIKADSVQVTDTGVTSQFSTRNATIPSGNEDPCFAGI